MEWVKLSTNYYLDPAIMRAGEAAEVLFTRALAFVGDHETDGMVPKEVLSRLTPLRGASRARSLVREGLWEVVPGGWRFVNWTKHQQTREQMAQRRLSGRERQANYRRRNAVTNAVSDGVTNGGVTRTEVEVEVDAAAAAGDAAAAAMPVAVGILRQRLQSHTALSALRFDQLTADQVAQLEDLITLHGDDRLVDVAIRTCRNPPPVSVSAFLGTWAHLPPPGQRIGLVRKQQFCDVHSTVLSPSGACSSCASDQKAAR